MLIKNIGIFEFFRLKRLDKFKKTSSKLFGEKINMVDSSTYLSLVNEIFIDEIYKFNSKNDENVIIDCGANIGLATIYFKLRFPNSKIIAFEPDPNIFDVLNANIKSFNFSNIDLHNSAISNIEGFVNFEMNGALSGMISNSALNSNTVSVKSVRLKDLLAKYNQIEFLKIDIEGHEDYVMEDIKEELIKVNYLFLEYHSFIERPQILDKILRIISEANLRYYIKESEFKKDPFISRSIFLNMDTVLNIFCYRD